MSKQLKNIYLAISYILSFASIITTIVINIVIAKEYLRVDRKTQILFGIKELVQFSYQYYIAILGMAAFIFAVIGAKHRAGEKRFFAAILLSLFSIIVVFLRVWRVFV